MSKQYQKSSSVVPWLLGLFAVAVLLLVVGASRNSTSSRTNRDVALACTTDMATQFHIHPHLAIVINGERQEIPANIGIRLSCMNALHTHDNSGQIHIESPETRDFTLADFFAVWDKPYSKDQILDSKVDEKHIIRETVNGREVSEYENTVLRDNDNIVLSYEQKK